MPERRSKVRGTLVMRGQWGVDRCTVAITHSFNESHACTCAEQLPCGVLYIRYDIRH